MIRFIPLPRVSDRKWQDAETETFVEFTVDQCSVMAVPVNGRQDFNMRRVTQVFQQNVCLDDGTKLPIFRGSFKWEVWTGGDLPVGQSAVIAKPPFTNVDGSLTYSEGDTYETLIHILGYGGGFLAKPCNV